MLIACNALWLGKKANHQLVFRVHTVSHYDFKNCVRVNKNSVFINIPTDAKLMKDILTTLSLSFSASVVDKATLLECEEKLKNAFSTANNFLRPLFDLFLPDR